LPLLSVIAVFPALFEIVTPATGMPPLSTTLPEIEKLAT